MVDRSHHDGTDFRYESMLPLLSSHHPDLGSKPEGHVSYADMVNRGLRCPKEVLLFLIETNNFPAPVSMSPMLWTDASFTDWIARVLEHQEKSGRTIPFVTEDAE
ncbi:hypothetical protein [Parvularcula maris]|uniref:Uncharacterized protein n=1 Tax=Parvularcula maris TaxID=2965077 RepID=A0A9X2RGH6_9PROT|nr:hypothetical protein [Parvularcula maris]MCQ8183944.1 hypothetical protein [Parvularcula maris]